MAAAIWRRSQRPLLVSAKQGASPAWNGYRDRRFETIGDGDVDASVRPLLSSSRPVKGVADLLEETRSRLPASAALPRVHRRFVFAFLILLLLPPFLGAAANLRLPVKVVRVRVENRMVSPQMLLIAPAEVVRLSDIVNSSCPLVDVAVRARHCVGLSSPGSSSAKRHPATSFRSCVGADHSTRCRCFWPLLDGGRGATDGGIVRAEGRPRRAAFWVISAWPLRCKSRSTPASIPMSRLDASMSRSALFCPRRLRIMAAISLRP